MKITDYFKRVKDRPKSQEEAKEMIQTSKRIFVVSVVLAVLFFLLGSFVDILSVLAIAFGLLAVYTRIVIFGFKKYMSEEEQRAEKERVASLTPEQKLAELKERDEKNQAVLQEKKRLYLEKKEAWEKERAQHNAKLDELQKELEFEKKKLENAKEGTSYADKELCLIIEDSIEAIKRSIESSVNLYLLKESVAWEELEKLRLESMSEVEKENERIKKEKEKARLAKLEKLMVGSFRGSGRLEDYDRWNVSVVDGNIVLWEDDSAIGTEQIIKADELKKDEGIIEDTIYSFRLKDGTLASIIFNDETFLDEFYLDFDLKIEEKYSLSWFRTEEAYRLVDEANSYNNTLLEAQLLAQYEQDQDKICDSGEQLPGITSDLFKRWLNIQREYVKGIDDVSVDNLPSFLIQKFLDNFTYIDALEYVGPNEHLVKLFKILLMDFYYGDDGEPKKRAPIKHARDVLSSEKNPMLGFIEKFDCFLIQDEKTGMAPDKLKLWKAAVSLLAQTYANSREEYDVLASNPWILDNKTYLNDFGTVRKRESFFAEALKACTDPHMENTLKKRMNDTDDE